MDKTTNCLNGEIAQGDLVISIPEDDYPCLVGTVLSIGKMRYSEKEYVFVNFMHPEYSANRLQEIEGMLCDAYGRPTTPGIWPLDIDNLPMSADSLIRITDISPVLLSAILDSEKAAEALCRLVHDSPAVTKNKQAAFMETQKHEMPSEPTDRQALRQQLLVRLDENFSDYCDSLMSFDKREIIGMAEDTSRRYAALEYLKADYAFRDGEIEYLLRFQDPLAFVAGKWPNTLDGLINMDEVVSDILQDKSGPEVMDNQGRLSLPPIPNDTSGAKEHNRQNGSGEKSVMEQLREAVKAPKEPPNPRKSQDKHESEL